MKPLKTKYEPYSNVEKLPAGGYVLEIKHVEYENNSDKGYNDKIVLAFDIYEGDFRDHFQRRYDAQTQEDKKWKGNYRLSVPFEDGSEEDNRTGRRFKTVTNSFEDSNPGYHWNWDEQTLKGKLIGGIFREKEYNFNGRTGFFTECAALTDVESIRSNTYRPLPTKYLDESKKPAPITEPDTDWVSVPEGVGDELPF